MKIPTKTLKNKFSLPIIGKGTWMTSLRKKNHHLNVDDTPEIEEIVNGFDNGITYIDTAERYANGYGEELIGKALKSKNYDRANFFIASKVSENHLDYNSTIFSAKASVKRLNASYLDLYLIHKYNANLPLKETMRAMDYLIEQKLIKNIGVCRFTVEQLKEAQSY